MDDVNYKKIKAWPFIEALKLENRLSKIPSKKIINFETGYGPSGNPHIGTFAEVLRTNMVRNCFKEISNIPTNLIAFSDDLDALRKVPEDYPFPEKLSEFIDSPLSSIPDFTGKYKSYADRNNNLLARNVKLYSAAIRPRFVTDEGKLLINLRLIFPNIL